MRRYFLVTVTLDPNLNPYGTHNPTNKRSDVCPCALFDSLLAGATCTDITGKHHTLLFAVEDDTLTLRDVHARVARSFKHVTRVEESLPYALTDLPDAP